MIKKLLTISFIIILSLAISNISVIAREVYKEHDEHKEYNKSRNLSIAAEVLNIPEEELKKQVNSGMDLYSLISEAGKLQDFKDKVLIELRSHLNEEIKRGRITKERAEEIYRKKKLKIDSWDGNLN